MLTFFFFFFFFLQEETCQVQCLGESYFLLFPSLKIQFQILPSVRVDIILCDVVSHKIQRRRRREKSIDE